jgi:hypothetical protein
MAKLTLPSKADIAHLDAYAPIFNAEVGGALRWVMQQLGIMVKILEQRIQGVSNSSWRAYTQASYQKNRPLHVVAAFCWLTQIGMSAVFQGKHIQHYWPTVCDQTIKSIILSGLLPEAQFQRCLQLVIEKMIKRGHKIRPNVINLLSNMPQFQDTFLMPSQLDINDFKMDYYRSIALQLRQFRNKHRIDIKLLSTILNEPISRIEAFEDPDNPVTIPGFTAVRFKLGFKLQDTVIFTSGMRKYAHFYYSREVQQAREKIMLSVIAPLATPERQWVNDLIKTVLKI